MTIQISGYVERTDTTGTPPGHVAVMVRFSQGDALPTTIFVHEHDAAHWPAGATVHLTAYAVPKQRAIEA